MNSRLCAVLLVLAIGATARAQVAAPARPAAPLPPVSWTCPMHADVVEDAKGTCRICKMELVPVRLVTVWTCPVHGVIAQETPGKCRICGRDLVPTTKTLTFTCTGRPDIGQLNPGRCADGTPMVAKYSARPHGDHNPKHGGLFFMAPDNWHHIEGTYPAAGQFRVYLYDDYSKPLPLAQARKVRARVVTKETFDPVTRAPRELATAPLVLARNGAFLEARIDPLALPATMTAKIAFGTGDKESRFDFTFPAFSIDAPAAAAVPSSSVKAPGGPIAALVNDLNARDREVGALVKSGDFGSIWVPALRAKDLALDIQASQPSSTMDAPVKQLVVAAYQLDSYGDLGDAQKIADAYRTFTAAVSAVTTLAAARPSP